MRILTKVLEKLSRDGKINLVGINYELIEALVDKESDDELERFCQEIKTPYSPPSFEIHFRHDWDSLIFWQPMNWRDFTLLKIAGETNIYSKYLELEIAVLGFHIEIDLYRPFGDKQ